MPQGLHASLSLALQAHTITEERCVECVHANNAQPAATNQNLVRRFVVHVRKGSTVPKAKASACCATKTISFSCHGAREYVRAGLVVSD